MLLLDRLRDLFQQYREIISYVFFGGLTTLVNWISYFVLVNLLGGGGNTAAVLWATILAQILSILFAYITNRKWVFKSRAYGFRSVAVEMVKFFSCRSASIFLDMGIMYVGVSLLNINDMMMKLFSNFIIIVVNYLLSKIFVFRGNSTKKTERN